jgi:hypothetical protein
MNVDPHYTFVMTGTGAYSKGEQKTTLRHVATQSHSEQTNKRQKVSLYSISLQCNIPTRDRSADTHTVEKFY